MRGKDCGNVDSALFAKGKSNTRQPLVEVSDDGLVLLVRHKLRFISSVHQGEFGNYTSPRNQATR